APEPLLLPVAGVAAACLSSPLPEMERKGVWVLVAVFPVATDAHARAIHPRLDRRRGLAVDRPGDVEPRDLSGERPAQRPDGNAHVTESRPFDHRRQM